VKELKDQHPVATCDPVGLWNPVKELKGYWTEDYAENVD